MSTNNWYKGNIHTHTTESDGDATPEEVVKWYRRHEYDFLVLSDHNHLTLLNYRTGQRRFKRPLMIPGQEVSVNIQEGATAIHVNGIGITRMVEPVDAIDVVPTLQANVSAILEAGGIASINHPNFKWSFNHESIIQVLGASLLEVFNGHPGVNVYGAPGKLSYEEIWDGVLSTGKAIFGVATDDSHNYSDFSPKQSNPGRGWVMVQAPQCTRKAIVDSLASGRFYASTGVAFTDLDISQKHLHLEIEQERDFIYTTTFTSQGGVILSEEIGLEAIYHPSGSEEYVRATVSSSSGGKAWTQPIFLP